MRERFYHSAELSYSTMHDLCTSWQSTYHKNLFCRKSLLRIDPENCCLSRGYHVDLMLNQYNILRMTELDSNLFNPNIIKHNLVVLPVASWWIHTNLIADAFSIVESKVASVQRCGNCRKPRTHISKVDADNPTYVCWTWLQENSQSEPFVSGQDTTSILQLALILVIVSHRGWRMTLQHYFAPKIIWPGIATATNLNRKWRLETCCMVRLIRAWHLVQLINDEPIWRDWKVLIELELKRVIVGLPFINWSLIMLPQS